VARGYQWNPREASPSQSARNPQVVAMDEIRVEGANGVFEDCAKGVLVFLPKRMSIQVDFRTF